MGYDVHVHRAEHWLDAEADPITLDEWRAYVDGCDDLRMDDAAETTTPAGDTIRIDSPGIAVWKPVEAAGGGWLMWSDGAIVVKNPDQPFLRRMHEIATALGAKVQGEEDELYGPDGEIVGEGEPPDDGDDGGGDRERGGILRRLFGRG